MKTIRFSALTGTVGGVLVMLAIGPALAGHGFTLTEHPLRGDFPTASETVEAAPASDLAATESKPVARQRDEPGGWLRGDFPVAGSVAGPADGKPEPAAAAAATAGLAETWRCSVDQTTAHPVDIGTAQAVMRVIHLDQ